MNGIIDVGGGLRGVFAAGVLDRCNEEGITADYCIGVSAGSGNMVSYLAGQVGRNLRFYVDYSLRKEYMGIKNFIRKGSYLDLDYIYSGLTDEDGEDPLDYDAFAENQAVFKVVATEAFTGRPVYFDKTHFSRNNYHVLKASSDLPFVCRPYKLEEGMYYDGGLSDPIPVERAFKDGCDKVAVILSRPRDFVRAPGRDKIIGRIIGGRYPGAARALNVRYRMYNYQMAQLKVAEKMGKAVIIAPDDCCGVDTLTRDRERLAALYQKGRREGEKIGKFFAGNLSPCFGIS